MKKFDLKLANHIVVNVEQKLKKDFKILYTLALQGKALYSVPYLTTISIKERSIRLDSSKITSNKLKIYLKFGYFINDIEHKISRNRIYSTVKLRKIMYIPDNYYIKNFSYEELLDKYMNSYIRKDSIEKALTSYIRTLDNGMYEMLNVDCAFTNILSGELDFYEWAEVKRAQSYC